MLRLLLSAGAGLLGLAAYVAVAVALGDVVQHEHWAVQALYFLVAGLGWTAPVYWLMDRRRRRIIPGS